MLFVSEEFLFAEEHGSGMGWQQAGSRDILFCQILAGMNVLMKGCALEESLSMKFRVTLATFIAAALPDGIKQVIAQRKQSNGEESYVADITLEHMSLLESRHLRMLRNFVVIHIALRFPILRAWEIAFSGYAGGPVRS